MPRECQSLIQILYSKVLYDLTPGDLTIHHLDGLILTFIYLDFISEEDKLCVLGCSIFLYHLNIQDVVIEEYERGV
jgi:hypothetical protein